MNNGSFDKKTIEDLIEVMAALRTPETGCPWDLVQDFSSIASYTLEEAYEVLDAISRNDLIDLREELGDLLLQVVYHARMAQERNAFDFTDVVDGITRKMVRRHPHVFGSNKQRAAGPQKGSWDRIKAQERSEKVQAKAKLAKTFQFADNQFTATPKPSTSTRPQSILDDIPLALPALVRAIKLQNKAAKVGFDWPALGPVFDKMREELLELEEVSIKADPRAAKDQVMRGRVEEEFGDLLFVIVNVARHLKIDAEGALRTANQKFTRRFQSIERALAARGNSVHQSDLEEMDELWEEAKRNEKSAGN